MEQQHQSPKEYTDELDTQQPTGMTPVNEAPPDQLRHSGLGIASFVISIISVLLGITGIILLMSDAVGMLNEYTNTDLRTQITNQEAMQLVTDYPGVFTGTLILMFTAFLMFIGAILGAVGLFQQRKKLFSILGVCINALPIVLFILFAIIGVMIG